MSDPKERAMSDEQLVHRVLQAERDLVAARFKHSMNQLENTSKLGVLRREIARLRTEARVREAAGGMAKNALFVRHQPTFGVTRGGAASAAPEKGGFLSGIVDKLTGKE
ncbi:MAG: 50S ribosomal protein L29 [Myxococcota bacterium]